MQLITNLQFWFNKVFRICSHYVKFRNISCSQQAQRMLRHIGWSIFSRLVYLPPHFPLSCPSDVYDLRVWLIYKVDLKSRLTFFSLSLTTRYQKLVQHPRILLCLFLSINGRSVTTVMQYICSSTSNIVGQWIPNFSVPQKIKNFTNPV